MGVRCPADGRVLPTGCAKQARPRHRPSGPGRSSPSQKEPPGAGNLPQSTHGNLAGSKHVTWGVPSNRNEGSAVGSAAGFGGGGSIAAAVVNSSNSSIITIGSVEPTARC